MKGKELIDAVVAWGEAKGIVKNVPFDSQLKKLTEEIGELIEAYHECEAAGIEDAFGDIQVVLILLNEIAGNDRELIQFDSVPEKTAISFEEHMTCLWRSVGRLAKASFKQDREMIRLRISNALCRIRLAAKTLDMNPEDTLAKAYQVIIKRTGTIKNDTFVKDEA